MLTLSDTADAPGTSQGIESAHLNGDSAIDAATVSPSTNQLVIFHGNEDGTFTQIQALSTGANPFNLKVGDFDEDNDVDIVVGNSGDAPLSLFLNQGDGTFASATTMSPEAAATGDWNGDNHLDFAVTHQSTASVSIYLGRGNGTFQFPVQLSTDSIPFGATSLDSNQDGYLDLVVTTLSNTLNIFLGRGDGTFHGKVSSSSPGSPRYLEAGNVNRDSKPDLAVSVYNAASIDVYRAR